MKEIKKINNSHIISPIYTLEKTNIDLQDSKIQNRENIFISQSKEKDDFIKMFVLNLEFIATELENSEKIVLFLMIANMNYKNIITIGAEMRSEILHKSKMHRNTISKAVSSLEEKKVILKLDTDELRKKFDIFSKNSYLINPNIIGKGSFRDLTNLRQTVVTNFDFKTLKMKKQIIRETEYNDFKEIEKNPQDFSFLEIKYNNDLNTSNTEILVEKKSNFNKKTNSILKFAGILDGTIDPNITAKDIRKQRSESIMAKMYE